eukprot:CAMPEP_0194579310 /NCGR_PEP_ID=MMETSP0292-20121207/13412_1 /TAXON_ID=39354 /ORGANISM="Heterosigma akashiwo, Strain CCMP2393" /LENGTH=54 /DNA_ID=CAMNT_0039432205 /DNA_START=92 /DNA_END=256 /DNA_ORIENTATION=+
MDNPNVDQRFKDAVKEMKGGPGKAAVAKMFLVASVCSVGFLAIYTVILVTQAFN